MHSKQLFERALRKEFLSADEGQFLFENTPLVTCNFLSNEAFYITKALVNYYVKARTFLQG